MLRHTKIRAHAALTILLACIGVDRAHAACTSPAGNEGDQNYNGDYHTPQFCNGTSWMAFSGGSNCTATGGYSPTTPSGSGYFVLSGGTYNGNLASATGNTFIDADALCLTDLTTNTGWQGYATANSNGQLVAAKVHAFICSDGNGGGPCNGTGLMPLTTYLFANAVSGQSAAGGASFTTDSTGNGPNDSADWSGASYFSGTYNYWQQRAGTGTTVFPTTATSFGSGGRCSGFTSSSSGDTGVAGTSANTGLGRWYAISVACNVTLPIICVVNP